MLGYKDMMSALNAAADMFIECDKQYQTYVVPASYLKEVLPYVPPLLIRPTFVCVSYVKHQSINQSSAFSCINGSV